MNLFFLQRALLDKAFQDAGTITGGNKLYLMTAYPGHPIDAMVELATDAVDIAILGNEGKIQMQRLLEPLSELRASFTRRTALSETMLWATAYVRQGGRLERAWYHWEEVYFGAASRRDPERYKGINPIVFEYMYRLMNVFPGGPRATIPAAGFIEPILLQHCRKAPDEIYIEVNKVAGFSCRGDYHAKDSLFKELLNATRGS